MADYFTGYDPDAIKIYKKESLSGGYRIDMEPEKWVLTYQDFKRWQAPIGSIYYVQQRLMANGQWAYLIGYGNAIHFMPPHHDYPVVMYVLHEGEKIRPVDYFQNRMR